MATHKPPGQLSNWGPRGLVLALAQSHVEAEAQRSSVTCPPSPAGEPQSWSLNSSIKDDQDMEMACAEVLGVGGGQGGRKGEGMKG